MSSTHPSAPDHHDAELVLKLYELRREPVMRESRDAISGQFMPRSFEDVAALAKVWPWMDRIRSELNPRSFRNAEWVATQTEAGKQVFGLFQARIEKQRVS